MRFNFFLCFSIMFFFNFKMKKKRGDRGNSFVYEEIGGWGILQPNEFVDLSGPNGPTRFVFVLMDRPNLQYFRTWLLMRMPIYPFRVRFPKICKYLKYCKYIYSTNLLLISSNCTSNLVNCIPALKFNFFLFINFRLKIY